MFVHYSNKDIDAVLNGGPVDDCDMEWAYTTLWAFLEDCLNCEAVLHNTDDGCVLELL